MGDVEASWGKLVIRLIHAPIQALFSLFGQDRSFYWLRFGAVKIKWVEFVLYMIVASDLVGSPNMPKLYQNRSVDSLSGCVRLPSDFSIDQMLIFRQTSPFRTSLHDGR